MKSREWNIEDVKRVIYSLDKKTGAKGIELPIEVNNRLTRAMGRYMFRRQNQFGKTVGVKPISFQFAPTLLDGRYDEATVRNTIIHEYCHYLTMYQYNRVMGHCKEFKANCKKLGGDGETYFYGKADEEMERKDREERIEKARKGERVIAGYRYLIKCAECGKVVARRNRLTKSLLTRYRSNCCHAKLTVEKLW